MSDRLRSLLFAPGNQPELMAKLPRSGPDAVVLDLEDGVPAGAKASSRPLVRAAAAQLIESNAQLRVFIRINAVASEWFDDDISALPTTLAGVVAPKIESRTQVRTLRRALARVGLEEAAIVAGIETVLGVDQVGEVAASGVSAVYFGAEDYVADLGGVRTIDNLEVLVPRSRVAMAARLAGVMALDQIVPDIADGARFSRDAAQGRSLGFAGKMCIHPAQVPWANAAFSSSAAEMDRARRVLAAAVDAEASGHGVFAFEGQMIDEPLLRQARSVLARGT